MTTPTPDQILKAARAKGMPKMATLDEPSCYCSSCGDILTWREVGVWVCLGLGE